MVTISKTDYLIYRECSKNAWMKLHKPDIFYLKGLSEFDKHITETGNEVERVARQLYPTGVLIEGRDEAAQKQTADLLAKHEPTLFQPIFVKDGFLAAVDVLKYDPATGGYAIYEIKASNEIDEKVHWYDIAFQVVLLRKCGLKIDSANLISLNREYKRAGALEITKLFAIHDVTKEIEATIVEVEAEMQRAQVYLSQENEPRPVGCMCIYKGRSKHCSTFEYSNPQVPAYGVHDIARIGSSKKKLTELVDGHIFTLDKIPEDMDFSDIQKNQIDTYVLDRPIIAKDMIAEEFEKLEYPLYFLDYETFPSAIPMFDGFSSYQQVPFQYSLYVLDKPDSGSEPKHFEFLYTKAGDPSMEFYESLKKNIGPKGKVVVWNKKFECMINRELADRRPETLAFMEDVNARVFDLMEIFSKQHYVHKDFHGSFSIKKVLPVLVPELSYKDLTIKEGGTASKTWYELVSGVHGDADEQGSKASEIAHALKVYCGLDTYAMYAIWKKLYELV